MIDPMRGPMLRKSENGELKFAAYKYKESEWNI